MAERMNLPTLIERYGSEEKCRELLERLRWPQGVDCPRCGGTTISRIRKRNQFDCDSCRYQFSVTAGTIFHDSHLPLWKWFLGIYLIAESKKGISAKQLERTLGVSYKTAWYMAHRIRSAMEEGSPVPLKGIVEIDETWIGGKHRRTPDNRSGRAHKKLVMGAIERGGEIRLELRAGEGRETRASYRKFVKDHVDDKAPYIFTDADSAWGDMTDWDTKHRKVDHRADEWVRGIVHTNTIEGVWSLLKRSVVGTYHQLSIKHLPAYLDEMAFRFNNRENPYLFRDTLLRMVEGDALPYQQLVATRD